MGNVSSRKVNQKNRINRQIVRVGIFLLVLFLVGCAETSWDGIILPGDCRFSFSPRLDRVIYECSNDSVRWLASLPSLEDAVPLTIADATPEIWSWAPDGTALLLSSYESAEKTETWWLVRIDNLDTRMPLCTMSGGVHNVVWSPTGTAFAAIDRMGGVTLVHTDGSGCEALPISGRVMRSLALSWSPDGQKIAYTYTPYPEGPEASQIHVIDLSTLYKTTVYPNGGLPDWSPGGEKIALFGWWGVIPVIRADGSGLISEVEIPEGYIVERSRGNVWSPDGSRLALYLRNDGPEEEPIAIGILDLDMLTISVFEFSYFSEILAWTPDGKAVVIRGHTHEGNILKEIPIVR